MHLHSVLAICPSTPARLSNFRKLYRELLEKDKIRAPIWFYQLGITIIGLLSVFKELLETKALFGWDW